MEVAAEFSIIELNGHCVMRVLVDGPDKSNEIET